MTEFRIFVQTKLAVMELPINHLVRGCFDPRVLRLDIFEGNSILDMRYADLINQRGIARELKNGDRSDLNNE